MSQQRLSPIAAPTAVGRYTGAIDATPLGAPARVSLERAADSGDGVAIYICDDATIVAGTATKPFDAADATSWPAGCELVAVLRGGDISTQVRRVTEWGPNVVVQRIAGNATRDVLISGEAGGGDANPTFLLTPTFLPAISAGSDGFVPLLTNQTGRAIPISMVKLLLTNVIEKDPTDYMTFQLMVDSTLDGTGSPANVGIPASTAGASGNVVGLQALLAAPYQLASGLTLVLSAQHSGAGKAVNHAPIYVY